MAPIYYYQYASTITYPTKPESHYAPLFSCALAARATEEDYTNDKCKPTLVCEETCANTFMLSDGNCDDGGPGSEYMSSTGSYGFCDPGTDCEDCGDRWLIWNPTANYVDFCDNVKGCYQSFVSVSPPSSPPSTPPPGSGMMGGYSYYPGRRLQDATLRAGRISTVYDTSSADYTKCFDILTMSLNGTKKAKVLQEFVKNRANLSIVVGLYHSCYSCEVFLQKMNVPAFKKIMFGAASLLRTMYVTYGVDLEGPKKKVLPVMPHCDNDFETMALKHSLGVDKSDTDTVASRRLEEEEDNDPADCGCPFMPNYDDEMYASWEQTRKSSGSFLKTLYRFTEVLMGKDLFRVGEGSEAYAAAWQMDQS